MKLNTLVDDVIGALTYEHFKPQVVEMADWFCYTIREGGRFFICGNGGSAADAGHLTAELAVRYARNRRALGAMNLAADAATVTAAGNDFGFDEVFARQVEGLMTSKDALVVFSTSGNSRNVIKAAQAARAIGADVYAFLGEMDEDRRAMWTARTTAMFCAPSQNTAVIQTCHQVAYHSICEYVENALLRSAC